MKLKQNAVMRFVFEPEHYNRVVAVYSLLIVIDKRVNKNRKIVKKAAAKKQKDGTLPDSYYQWGSHKKRASDIFEKRIKTFVIARRHDRYDYTYDSSCSIFH